MLFNSLSFLLLFLPVSVLGFYGLARFRPRLAAAWLVGASVLFYTWWNVAFVALLLGSIAFNFCCGWLIQRCAKRELAQQLALSGGVIANLSLLFYYKYFAALVQTLAAAGWTLPVDVSGILLPLGISFFTFTQVGYLVDCKAGLVKGSNLLDYMLFVTFFPHLIAGPILHHREMMPQFSQEAMYRFNGTNFTIGMAIFILGLAKKVLLADTFAPIAHTAFDHPEGVAAVTMWCGVLSYMLELYFDFSGYSEMAMGLARMVNLKFPANFDSPFKSRSIIEYWQRFHMTLTRYITLYVYNPIALAAVRRRTAQGKPIAGKGLATAGGFFSLMAVPTFAAVTLAGVWHGAGWQFFIYGLLHSSYLCVNHAWRLLVAKKKNASAAKRNVFVRSLDTMWKVLLTTLCVMVSQVFFRAASAGDAVAVLKGLVGLNGWAPPPDAPPLSGTPHGIVEGFLDMLAFGKVDNFVARLNHLHAPDPLTILVVFVGVWSLPNILQLFAAYAPSLSKPHDPAPSWLQWRPSAAWGLFLGVLAAATVMAVTGTKEFLYFQF